MTLTPGQSISGYRIIGSLGAGGMGVVYRARDDRLERDVAIKVLPKAWADDPEHSRRFEREARLLGALSHQNVAAAGLRHRLRTAGDCRHVDALADVQGVDGRR